MFSISFDTDNDEFSRHPEVGIVRILREIAKRIADGETEGSIRDVNGNRIGSFRMEDR